MKIKGNITSLITPFKKNGNIDFKKIKKNLIFQIKSGIKNFLILGTTGEPHNLSIKKKIKIIKYCVKIIKKKANIICGNCNNSIERSLKFNKRINKIKGIKAILQVVPYYLLPEQKGIFNYFKKISKLSKIPLIIYNIPKRCSINLKYSTVKKISKLKKIIGIKYSTKNLSDFIEFFNEFNCEEFKVFSGDDINFHIKYIIGSEGNISVASNVIPKKMNKIYNLIKKKKISKSLKEYKKIHSFLKILFIETNPIPLKYILYKLGMSNNILKLPLTKTKKKNKLKIFKLFKNV
ncbi:4-hydroxy-tetrahydrodipicolinate synthase [Candidatus Vidania fulgoroideorum]